MAAVTDTAVEQQPSRAVSGGNEAVPQSPAKVPQSLSVESVIDEDETESGEMDFAGQLEDAEWRREFRKRYRKTDGVMIVYWNLRARKITRVDGKRKIEYRKGGSMPYEQAKGRFKIN